MSDLHIFEAGGDNCPICDALDGQEVEPGYKPHDGCQCETDVRDHLGDCQWSFASLGTTRTGNSMGEFIWLFEVAVQCPNGDVLTETVEMDGQDYVDSDGMFESISEEMEHAAQELCGECEMGYGDPDFSIA